MRVTRTFSGTAAPHLPSKAAEAGESAGRESAGRAPAGARVEAPRTPERVQPLPFLGWGPLLPVLLLSASGACALAGTALDTRLFLAINSWSRATGGLPWSVASLLGEGTVLLGLAALLLVRRPALLAPFLLATLLLFCSLHPLKLLFDSPRPLSALGDQVLVVGRRLGKESFPSGHTAVAFLAAHLLMSAFRRPGLRALVLVLALACGLSRIVVGAHWPVDVLAGVGLGWTCGGLGLLFASRLRAARGRFVELVLPLLCAGISLVLALRRPQDEAIALVRDGIGAVSACLAVWFVWRSARAARLESAGSTAEPQPAR